jgi:superkiller protein 3
VRKSHYFRGNCFLRLKRYGEAVSDYEEAIKVDPTSPDAWHRLAHAHRCMHEHADALSCVEKAIELNPNDAYAFNLKASILLESDDFLQYRQFLLTPLKPIESVYYKIRENIRKVIEGYSKAIEITPEYSEALEKRGKLYLFLGNHDKSNGIDESGNLKNAIDDFKKSVFLGRKVESHYWLGVAYHLNSDFNEAQLHFKEALEACGEGKLKSKITEILETESNHQKLQIAMLQDKGFKVSANK